MSEPEHIPVEEEQLTGTANAEEGEKDMCQSEKNLVRHLWGQLHWGMTLERITLPTFILCL